MKLDNDVLASIFFLYGSINYCFSLTNLALPLNSSLSTTGLTASSSSEFYSYSDST